MVQYPLHFEAEVHSKGGKNTPFEARAADYPSVVCAVPQEFGGGGGGYSPEDLYMMSIAGCLIATFKVFAEKGQLAFTEIHSRAKLTVDRNTQGVPELQKIDLIFTLTGVEDQEKARKILAESEKYCLVSNAIKSEKSFTYNFV